MAKELYEVHMDVNESIDGAMASLYDIHSNLEEEISCLSTSLNKIRNVLELCGKALRKLTKRMPSEFLSPCDTQKEFWEPPDEELPFLSHRLVRCKPIFHVLVLCVQSVPKIDHVNLTEYPLPKDYTKDVLSIGNKYK